jgi:hypothetical protein
MENKKLTIEDLLNSLQNPNKTLSLENTKETWMRIGAKDSFSELGLGSSELNDFLQEWVANNDYNNI